MSEDALLPRKIWLEAACDEPTILEVTGFSRSLTVGSDYQGDSRRHSIKFSSIGRGYEEPEASPSMPCRLNFTCQLGLGMMELDRCWNVDFNGCECQRLPVGPCGDEVVRQGAGQRHAVRLGWPGRRRSVSEVGEL